MSRLSVFLAALLLCSATQASAPVAAAAKHFYPKARWYANTIINADFTCEGRTQSAILGVTKTEYIVAVFVRGVNAQPEFLRFSAASRSRSAASISLEDLDFNLQEIEQQLGYLPDGLSPSKKCMGIAFGDGETDSAHIYWNRRLHRFQAWSL